jgi:MFS family permease
LLHFRILGHADGPDPYEIGLQNAFAILGKGLSLQFANCFATLGFAAGLLLLVPLGDRFDRRRLVLIQRAALTLSLAAAALAPDAWSLVVASALVGGTSSVAQPIVPFAAELAEPSRRGANIGIVTSGLLCGVLFGRVLVGAVGDRSCSLKRLWLDQVGAVPETNTSPAALTAWLYVGGGLAAFGENTILRAILLPFSAARAGLSSTVRPACATGGDLDKP